MMQKLKMHPDLGGDHEGAALLNEAFAVLSNPDSRAVYDARNLPESEPAPAADWPNNNESPTAPNLADPDDDCPFCRARCRAMQHREPDDVCGTCRAPLFPAEPKRFGVDSQRAIERIPKQTPAAFSVNSERGPRHRGLVQDISPNGLQLHTSTELQNGQVVLIQTDVLDAVAQVVDSRRIDAQLAATWRVGMAFLTIKLHRSRGSFVSVDV